MGRGQVGRGALADDIDKDARGRAGRVERGREGWRRVQREVSCRDGDGQLGMRRGRLGMRFKGLLGTRTA